MTADLTLVVTAHDETTVSGPTMHSADRAVAAAREAGWSVQQVVALGAPTEATAAYFGQALFDHWDRRRYDEGDPGLLRNAVVSQVDSRYVAFLAAADLVSDNWLATGAAALDEAAGRGERAVAHPELTVVFDGAKGVRVSVDQRSPLFAPHHLYLGDHYDPSCLAPREAHLEVPYVGRDRPGGLPAQALEFTVGTLEAGWRHLVVRDTLVFRRGSDGPEDAPRPAVARSLPGLAIDRVRDLGREGRRG